MKEHGPFRIVTDSGGRVNAGFVATGRGTVAIDSMFGAEDVARLQETAASSGAPPIRYVILTHAHPDHVLGLAAYDADIIAERATARAMPERRHLFGEVDLPEPQIQFEGTLTLRLDEVELQIRRMGGHAPEQCVIWDPAGKTLWASDLVFNGRPPFIHPHADLQQWLAALEELEADRPALVVPGHGEPGGPELLSAQRVWIEGFLERLQTLAGEGRSADEAAEIILGELDVPERLHEVYRRAVADRYPAAS